MTVKKLSRTGFLCVCVTAGILAATGNAAEKKQNEKSMVNSIGMKLVFVSPGTYTFFGNRVKSVFLFPKNDSFKVDVKRGFYLGVYEVSQEQYSKVMKKNPSSFRNPKHPVENVSWNEAMEFCRRLSGLAEEKKAGRIYSLPSEREWQYAARAGSDFLFPYGSDDESRIGEIAVCRDSYTDSVPAGTAPVGTKQANKWGFHDMLGNVWEWCLDAQTSKNWRLERNHPPNGVETKGDCRVITGGDWDNDFRMCNCAARWQAYPTKKANNIGFRVRCIVSEGKEKTALPSRDKP
ncbi:MAG: formylglycine-generating enzyme family protein [Kiritimatiellae bacterium]|nr:formylglycine-generating enzyme family protein [Kiritimatiellia bacterium]